MSDYPSTKAIIHNDNDNSWLQYVLLRNCGSYLHFVRNLLNSPVMASQMALLVKHHYFRTSVVDLIHLWHNNNNKNYIRI